MIMHRHNFQLATRTKMYTLSFPHLYLSTDSFPDFVINLTDLNLTIQAGKTGYTLHYAWFVR